MCRSKRMPALSVRRGVIAHESWTKTPELVLVEAGRDRRVVDRAPSRARRCGSARRSRRARASRSPARTARAANCTPVRTWCSPRQRGSHDSDGAPGAALLRWRCTIDGGGAPVERRLRDVDARQRVGREVGLVVERPRHVVPGEAGVEQEVRAERRGQLDVGDRPPQRRVVARLRRDELVRRRRLPAMLAQLVVVVDEAGRGGWRG